MSVIIDRRLNPRDKTIKNRRKFIDRSRERIKEVVRNAIDKGNIADIENGKIKVKVKGVSEPNFGFDHESGDKKYVMPGNTDYVPGDTIKKPQGGGKGSGKEGSPDGGGEDDFEFVLNPDEFMDFIFDDLELPDLVKKQIKDVTKTQMKRSGYTNTGNPCQLDVVRSLKNGMGRRIGLGRPSEETIEELEKELEEARKDNKVDLILELEERLEFLKGKMVSIPWLDPVDVRYRNFVEQPQPMFKAVMFCVMDISGSMTDHEKDIAKRFFFLLHMFLRRKYEKVEIVFIRHHESAKECDEQEFFHSRETGGTRVSSALTLTKEIIDQRYSPSDWNIYVAQASDGDNWSSDSVEVKKVMDQLLPMVQYFAYLEIAGLYTWNSGSPTDLWETYDPIADTYKHLAMRRVAEKSEIWKIFRQLFAKENTK